MAKSIQKPVLFISHITEEKKIAKAFADMVEHSFLGMVEPFVSSIPIGKEWLAKIYDDLRRAEVGVVICSPASVRRPWINWESGSMWIREKYVVPLCHSGMTYGDLPYPLASLQAGMATDVESLKQVMPHIAKAIGCTMPKIDFAGFIEVVKEYEATTKQNEILVAEKHYELTDGLAEHEEMVLLSIADNLATIRDSTAVSSIVTDADIKHYRPLAVTLGLALLERKGLVETKLRPGDYDGCEWYSVSITEAGWDWIFKNQSRLKLRKPGPPKPPPPKTTTQRRPPVDDGDIPF
jgi:hypothetical protein